MSENVRKLTELSDLVENVGKCRKMSDLTDLSEKIGKCWKMLENCRICRKLSDNCRPSLCVGGDLLMVEIFAGTNFRGNSRRAEGRGR